MCALDIHLSRDSVAAGDDVESHDQTLAVDGRRPFGLVIRQVVGDRYLPLIQGGKASWVVRLGRDGRPLAVVAQQWSEPQLLEADEEIALTGYAIHFEYVVQRDPTEVLNELRDEAP